MIEIINGMTETINYGTTQNGAGKLYHNAEYEDYPPHWHVGIEIIMPLKNTYTVTAGKEGFCLEMGEILIINSGVVHELTAPPEGERIIFQFDPSMLYLVKDLEVLLHMLPGVIHIDREMKIYSQVKKHMDRIVEEYDGEATFRGAVIYASLIEMFVEIGREIMQRAERDTAKKLKNADIERGGNRGLEVIMRACDYINAHYQEKLKLEDVAEIVGFSKYHFTRVFKQYLNMTFNEYLNKKRIQCAESLLCSTDMNITDVAMDSGFSSISAFNRTFRELNQQTPSDFREMYRQGRFTARKEEKIQDSR